LERLKDHLELTGATGAGFEMLSHAVKKTVDRRAIENSLSVLVQLIKAFPGSSFPLLASAGSSSAAD
jgi:hypothetical protein